MPRSDFGVFAFLRFFGRIGYRMHPKIIHINDKKHIAMRAQNDYNIRKGFCKRTRSHMHFCRNMYFRRQCEKKDMREI